jgi:pimeloyl-ACP methyl ester carboxylesterase
VRFEPFVWSGGYTQSARLQGTARLATHLTKLITAWPNAAHFVIGHSHGGTVALYALRDRLDIRERLNGLVLLATPIVQVRPRRVDPYELDILSFIPLLLAWAAAWVGSSFLEDLFGIRDDSGETLLDIGLFFGLFFLLILVIWQKNFWGWAAPERWVENIRGILSVTRSCKSTRF